MRPTILLLILLLATVYAEGGCPVYKCGDIPQDQDSQICVKRPEGNDQTWLTQTCPEEAPFCQIRESRDGKSFIENSICGTDSTAEFLREYNSNSGSAADGEYCIKDRNCYLNREGKSKCIDNVCTSNKKIGDS